MIGWNFTFYEFKDIYTFLFCAKFEMLAWPENSFRATRQIGHLKTFLNVTSLDTQDVKQLTKRRLKVQKR